MKNKLKMLPLLAICSVAQSNELDNLIDASSDILNQINTGVLLVGAASEYAYSGSGLSDGTLSSTAHISTEQLDAYNNALSNFAVNYKPFGDVQTVLEDKAAVELEMMDEAIGVFTKVVVDMISVEFFEQGVENANTTAEQTTVFYDANQQWVAMGYNTTRNLTAVYLNGQNFNLDMYVSEADVLLAGSESDFYLSSPLANNCYMYGECE
jgi:hypothetical protein